MLKSRVKASWEGTWLANRDDRGFPKIRGTILRVPRIRIMVFWGLNWGPLI